MEYTTLGTTGMKVSRLCFGTMSFGGRADKATSKEMYQACRDAGVNFFDCANVYQKGVAEEFLGEFIQGHRDEIVITTKGYGAMNADLSDAGSSRKHLVKSLHDSLNRLNTDYVDLYFIHQFDPKTAMVETLGTLQDFVASGKVLSVGVSNYAAWQIEKLLGLSNLHNLVKVQCLQPMYNIAKRQVEVEILPMAQEENLGVITYSPLGGGLLTGRYGAGQQPQSGRLVENPMYGKRYGGQFYDEVATNFTAYAKSLNVAPASLAVAWVASNPAITAPIIGAANLEQLKQSLSSVDIKVDAQMKEAIDAISPPPPPATDRSEKR